jgi:hypothetical protein
MVVVGGDRSLAILVDSVNTLGIGYAISIAKKSTYMALESSKKRSSQQQLSSTVHIHSFEQASNNYIPSTPELPHSLLPSTTSYPTNQLPLFTKPTNPNTLSKCSSQPSSPLPSSAPPPSSATPSPTSTPSTCARSTTPAQATAPTSLRPSQATPSRWLLAPSSHKRIAPQPSLPNSIISRITASTLHHEQPDLYISFIISHAIPLHRIHTLIYLDPTKPSCI